MARTGGRLERTTTGSGDGFDSSVLSQLPIIARPLVGEPSDGDHAEGRYGDFSLLGSGGGGVVFSARDRNFDREVAIKVSPHKSRSGTVGAVGNFVHEARLTASLEHPNILPVYDIDRTADGRTYFTMQKATGQSLADLIRAAAADPDHPPAAIASDVERIHIIDQVCNAVAFAHAQGIVHQDIKPANIVLGEFGQVMLVDWGTALRVEEREARDRVQLMGTPAYMAPEQARGEGVDERSDIYCLGATLFHLLTLHYPTTWDESEDVDEKGFWDKKRRGVIDAPEVSPDQVPPYLMEVARRALAVEPADRYPDVSAFQADLRAYRDHRESIRLTTIERQHVDRAQNDLLALADCIAHIDRALELWSGNSEARSLRRHACEQLLLAALQQEDLTLARRTLTNAAGALDHHRPQVDALAARLRSRRRRWIWFVAAGGLSAVAVVVLVILLAREWQRTRGFWYDLPAIDLQAGMVHGLAFQNRSDGSLEPVWDYDLAVDGLEMLGPDILWLTDHAISGDVRVHVECTWQRVDGFAILHHAERDESAGSSAHVPVSYSCQFAAYRGAYSYIAVNRERGAPQPMVTAGATFEEGQRYRLTFEREGEWLRMMVDGEVIAEDDLARHVLGAHTNAIGLRSWGEATVHRIEIERRSIPRYDDPLARGDRAAAYGYWQEAEAIYRQIADEHPDTDLAARAIARAIDAQVHHHEAVDPQQLWALFRRLQYFGDPSHLSSAAETMAEWSWREGDHENALSLAEQAMEHDPGTRIAPRLLQIQRHDLTPVIQDRLLDQLSQTRDLQVVQVSGMDLTNLEFLRGQPVRVLWAKDNRISDLAPLSEAQLQHVDLGNCPVQDLRPLTQQQLRTINLTNTQVADLSPLVGMPITSISVDRTHVTDIGPVASSALTSISFDRTAVENIAPLVRADLTYLSARHTDLTDLSPVAGQPIRKLYLNGSTVADIGPLASLLELEQVHLSGTQVSDIAPVCRKSVWELMIADCPVRELAPLYDDNHLWRLDVSGIHGVDLDRLSSIPRLEHLTMRDCGIESLEIFDPARANRVETLDLTGNPLRMLGAWKDQPPKRFHFDAAHLQEDVSALVEAWRNDLDRPGLADRLQRQWALVRGDQDLLREQARRAEGVQALCVEERSTWPRARSWAQGVGGGLAVPRTPEELALFESVCFDQAWTGVVSEEGQVVGLSAALQDVLPPPPATGRAVLQLHRRWGPRWTAADDDATATLLLEWR